MNLELQQFIETAKSKGLEDKEIRQKLVEAGWPSSDVDSALFGDELKVPMPPIQSSNISKDLSVTDSAPQIDKSRNGGLPDPIPVVSSLSTRGLEYGIMFLSLFASAISVGWILHQFVNGLFPSEMKYYSSSAELYTFPVTVIIVCFPFSYR